MDKAVALLDPWKWGNCHRYQAACHGSDFRWDQNVTLAHWHGMARTRIRVTIYVKIRVSGLGLMLGLHFRVRFSDNVGELQSVCQRALSACIGTNLIHDFTAVTFSVKLAFFREKRLFPWRFQSFISSFCADFAVSYYVSHFST